MTKAVDWRIFRYGQKLILSCLQVNILSTNWVWVTLAKLLSDARPCISMVTVYQQKSCKVSKTQSHKRTKYAGADYHKPITKQKGGGASFLVSCNCNSIDSEYHKDTLNIQFYLFEHYIFFQGHDTTSSAISWAIHALGKYPDAQEKVFD